jgi:signal transduction histidine kinase
MLNLHAETEKVVRDLAPLAASAETEVRNEIDQRFEVYSDETLLAQILQNLLSNALKFTSKGIIEIGAREINEGEAVECWVKDSGQGIPAAAIDKVFERFETSPEPGQTGMGLGLAIVKELIELHHGEIRVESEVGKGSTFTFVLPVKEFS